MTDSPVRASKPWRTLIERIEKPLTGLFLTFGLATFGAPYLPAYSSEMVNGATQANGQADAVISRSPLPDGVYLYGQSPQPNQVGSAYMVFEVKQGQLVGAFYMPYSSFDCFHGNFDGDRVALTVVNSYEKSAYPYSIALQPTDNVASANGAAPPVTIEGYQPISTVSSNDQRILSTCRADYQHGNG